MYTPNKLIALREICPMLWGNGLNFLFSVICSHTVLLRVGQYGKPVCHSRWSDKMSLWSKVSTGKPNKSVIGQERITEKLGEKRNVRKK